MNLRTTAGCAVVTGGAGGMGTAIVRRLLNSDLSVGVLDTDAALARSAADFGARDQIALVDVDVRSRTSVVGAVERVTEALGPPSVLVTAAGSYLSAPLEEVTDDHWTSVLETNLSGTFYAAQACVASMKALGTGTMVLISSTGGKVGWPGNHAYCASKAGVIGLMRVLALELAPSGIRVNAVCPGNTDTPMMNLVDADVSEAEGQAPGWFKESLKTTIPLGRMASPEDIADVVGFLCSTQSRHITGQALNVDGGLVPS